MEEKPTARDDTRDVITPRARRLVSVWTLAIVLLYAVSAFFGARTLRGYEAETEQARQDFLQAATIDSAHVPDAAVLAKATEVSVGIYVNAIGDVSTRDGTWTEDFDIWFRWQNSPDAPIDPGATFQVVNGAITERDEVVSYATGAERYARYRVRARFTKAFDPGRYPFGNDALTTQVEDGAHGVDRVRYVADEQSSGVNRRAVPRGVAVTQTLVTVKYLAHESTLGDPRAGAPKTHSLLVFAMVVAPTSSQLYLKNFQALFAAIAVTFIVFFIRPIHVDARFGLPVGAIFTATANNLMVVGSLPPTGRFTLAAMVNAAGLATIFLTLVESAISLYLLDTLGRERLYRWIDRCSFVALLLGYLSLNVVLVWAATR